MRTYSFLAAAFLAIGFVPDVAMAQECPTGLCGAPNLTGGSCGCGCGSILIAMTDLGDTYQNGDDADQDGREDPHDNCPFTPNPGFADLDQDGIGDACDNCAGHSNLDQADMDRDGEGDACDTDIDGDGFDNGLDNCDTVYDINQTDDVDAAGNPGGDGIGDACQGFFSTTNNDVDGDGIPNDADNCPYQANEDQLNTDADLGIGDAFGDVCDTDIDNDGWHNAVDNCANIHNPDQIDRDLDGLGDNGTWGTGDIAESCDPRECYVIAGDAANCLDPNAPFAVTVKVIGEESIEVGDEVEVALFSNRLHTLHNWEARFNELPGKSNTTLFNAQGSGTTLGDLPTVANCIRQGGSGACEEQNTMRFVADEPGVYEVKVNVTLPNGDPQSLGNTLATAIARVEVEEGGNSGGCTGGAGTGMMALTLGLLAVLRRRRRR